MSSSRQSARTAPGRRVPRPGLRRRALRPEDDVEPVPAPQAARVCPTRSAKMRSAVPPPSGCPASRSAGRRRPRATSARRSRRPRAGARRGDEPDRRRRGATRAGRFAGPGQGDEEGGVQGRHEERGQENASPRGALDQHRHVGERVREESPREAAEDPDVRPEPLLRHPGAPQVRTRPAALLGADQRDPPRHQRERDRGRCAAVTASASAARGHDTPPNRWTVKAIHGIVASQKTKPKIVAGRNAIRHGAPSTAASSGISATGSGRIERFGKQRASRRPEASGEGRESF